MQRGKDFNVSQYAQDDEQRKKLNAQYYFVERCKEEALILILYTQKYVIFVYNFNQKISGQAKRGIRKNLDSSWKMRFIKNR